MESRLVRFVQQAIVWRSALEDDVRIQRDDARQRVQSQDLPGVVFLSLRNKVLASRARPVSSTATVSSIRARRADVCGFASVQAICVTPRISMSVTVSLQFNILPLLDQCRRSREGISTVRQVMSIHDRFCKVSRNRLPRYANKLVKELWAVSLSSRGLLRTPCAVPMKELLSATPRNNPSLQRSGVDLLSCQWGDGGHRQRKQGQFAECSLFQSLMWCFSIGSDLPTPDLTSSVGDKPR